MKKIFILLFISVFCVSLISNAQDPKETEGYKKAEEFYGQANEAQNEGQYDNSYELAKLANDELNVVYIEAIKALMIELKGKADADIKKATDAGAPTQDATAALTEAEKATALIGTFEGVFEQENENYEKAVSNYTNASKLATTSLDNFIKQKTGDTQKVITSAKSKYNELLAKNIIKKNDANDKSISTMLASADTSLKAQKFDDAQKNANQAMTSLSGIEKDVGTKIASNKQSLDASKAKYNELVKANVIKKGDDNDKKIVALHADSNKLLTQNSFDEASKKANDANQAMTDIESSHKNEMDKAKKAIDDASNKHNQFLADSTIVQDDDNDKNVQSILKSANDALAKNDASLSQQEAERASTTLDNIKNGKEGEVILLTTANIEDQLRKIRDMVASLVTNNMIDKDSQEVANINSIIDRIKTSLGEEDLETAKEDLTNLVDTVDKVVTDAPKDGVIQILPKYYIVREKTPVDSLWNIAGYSFIYSDARYWDTLYNANRNILTDAENPHVILPGQILEIPSLRGEVREGTYTPGSEYITFE